VFCTSYCQSESYHSHFMSFSQPNGVVQPSKACRGLLYTRYNHPVDGRFVYLLGSVYWATLPLECALTWPRTCWSFDQTRHVHQYSPHWSDVGTSWRSSLGKTNVGDFPDVCFPTPFPKYGTKSDTVICGLPPECSRTTRTDYMSQSAVRNTAVSQTIVFHTRKHGYSR